MDNQVKEFKEKFLSEIDNDGFSKDERLVIAGEGFDKAFQFGVDSVTEELPEGQVDIGLGLIVDDPKNIEDGDLKVSISLLLDATQAGEGPKIKDSDIEAILKLKALRDESMSRKGNIFGEALDEFLAEQSKDADKQEKPAKKAK